MSADAYIMGILQGDATLTGLVANRIYLERTHADAKTPFVLVTYADGEDVSGAGAGLVMTTSDYVVRAVTKTSDASADVIAARINLLLHKSGGNAPLGVFGCARTKPFFLSEDYGATTYKHTGAIYRVFANGD